MAEAPGPADATADRLIVCQACGTLRWLAGAAETDAELDPRLGGLIHMCVRHYVYPHARTYAELVALITGYELGAFGIKSSRMEWFGQWLASRAGDAGRCSWSETLLKWSGGDEVRAMEQLGPLVRECMASGGFDPRYRSA